MDGPAPLGDRAPRGLLARVFPDATRVVLVVVVAVSGLALLDPQLGLVELLAKDNDAIRAGEVWRLLTAGLVHGSPLHLVMNAMVLNDVGRLVESLFGFLRDGPYGRNGARFVELRVPGLQVAPGQAEGSLNVVVVVGCVVLGRGLVEPSVVNEEEPAGEVPCHCGQSGGPVPAGQFAQQPDPLHSVWVLRTGRYTAHLARRP